MHRRNWLKAAGGLTILKSGVLRGANAPSNKLNIALIGVWGRGTAHYNMLRSENVVALCDINDLRTREALKIFPQAKTYWDWRQCLDQKDVEAVVVCTADHQHAFIANWALNRNMHVYCEKPLGISVEEARTVRANYLKHRGKVATQHGTQRHALPNFERLRELILDGAIGQLQTVHAWDARQLPRPGYPANQGQPPAGVHYEQWIGPSPYHPYSPQYFGGGSGANCLFWNMYRDFGVGQMGDMGAHTMDLLWNSIDAGAPSAIEVDQKVSDKFDPNITPVKLKVSFEHPANGWRGPVKVVWYQGGLKPEAPRRYLDIDDVGNGVIFEGTKGSILADFSSRAILPNNDDGDFTYYKRRGTAELLPLVGGTGQKSPAPARRARPASAKPAQRGGTAPDGFPEIHLLENGMPPALGLPNEEVQKVLKAEQSGRTLPGPEPFQRDWLDACKGKSDGVVHGTSHKTHCDFDYAGTMIEQMLLGLVAHCAGQRIEYDAAAGRITNLPEANRLLKREYRAGWSLNG